MTLPKIKAHTTPTHQKGHTMHHVTLEDAKTLVRQADEVGISTFLGVAWITKKEALHLLNTQEEHNASIWVSVNDYVILEHGNEPVGCCLCLKEATA